MKNKETSRKAKFFCENCGSEVPENAKVCKTCGKFFISVRCPKCGATGSHEEFLNGCPKCGYAVGGNHYGGKTLASSEKKSAPKETSGIFRGFRRKNSFSSARKTSETSLPVWVYIVTSLAFLAVVFAVYSCFRRPY